MSYDKFNLTKTKNLDVFIKSCYQLNLKWHQACFYSSLHNQSFQFYSEVLGSATVQHFLVLHWPSSQA